MSYAHFFKLKIHLLSALDFWFLFVFIGKKQLKGQVVSPVTPYTEAGLYWGYRVRLANSLGKVFTECPYKSGYDLTIGTSENGGDVDQLSPLDYR